MSMLESELPRENPLLTRLMSMLNEKGYRVLNLEEVNEGAFAAIIDNGPCKGPFAFFTGDPVPLQEDPIDWNKFSSFEPDFQAYHYCPILPSELTDRDMSEMLGDAKQLIGEAGQLRWKQWHDSLGTTR